MPTSLNPHRSSGLLDSAVRKTRKVRIPFEWMGLVKGKSLEFWVKVAIVCRRRKIRKGDLAKVKAIAIQLSTQEK